jgi:hypothetical protein
MLYDSVIGTDKLQGMQTALKLFQDLKDHPVRDASVICQKSKLSAPRSDEKANGGTSVEAAVDTWCRDNDGKTVGTESLYWRWGVTNLGVPERSSFWLRATKTCDKTETFDRWECKKALLDGMKKCDKDSSVTHGLAASISCVDYSIEFSGTVDADPPWARKREDRKFPPPESAEKKDEKGKAYEPQCNENLGIGGSPLSDDDLNKGIDAFCQNGNEIRGFGQYSEGFFDYPPSNEPQFSTDDPYYNMHLTMGAETINNGGEDPYEDMRWCRYVQTNSYYANKTLTLSGTMIGKWARMIARTLYGDCSIIAQKTGRRVLRVENTLIDVCGTGPGPLT